MIQIRDLSKAFDGVPVLRDVDLDVPDGEVTCIIGRSGSGKSVLMRHVIGLLKPDTGRVVVDGAPLDELTYSELRQVRRKFGVLFQGGALFDSMSARENVEFPLRTFTELTPAEVTARASECLELVELPDAGPKKPAELSGGQQKRVALARAIAIEPKYILYDEPTSGLDPETSNTIDELIQRLGSTMGTTSIVVTHDMHSVLSIADRVAFVHEGTIRWTGTVSDLHHATDPALVAFVRANEYKIGVPSQTA
ncbi:ABC transporter ATP-binding protein [Rubrivirga sp. IMCC43871]|uniref:ABC transporter ATP-binding protein n=1 Tax=Rubrivirga sp. IMCC43871 TaxID=3391575 RepID=UPI00398FE26E